MKKKDLINNNIKMMNLVGIEIVQGNNNYLPLQELHNLLYQNVVTLIKKKKWKKK